MPGYHSQLWGRSGCSPVPTLSYIYKYITHLCRVGLGITVSCGAGQVAHLPRLYLDLEVLRHAVPENREHLRVLYQQTKYPYILFARGNAPVTRKDDNKFQKIHGILLCAETNKRFY